MNAAPAHASPKYATRRARGGPPNSTNTRTANEPKAARSEVCGCWMTLSASAKTAGITIAARAALFSAARSGTARDDTPAPCVVRSACRTAYGAVGSPLVLKGYVVGGLSALALLVVPSAWASGTPASAHRPTSAPIRPFVVYGVASREQ